MLGSMATPALLRATIEPPEDEEQDLEYKCIICNCTRVFGSYRSAFQHAVSCHEPQIRVRERERNAVYPVVIA